MRTLEARERNRRPVVRVDSPRGYWRSRSQTLATGRRGLHRRRSPAHAVATESVTDSVTVLTVSAAEVTDSMTVVTSSRSVVMVVTESVTDSVTVLLDSVTQVTESMAETVAGR